MVENVGTSIGPGRRIYLDHVGGAPWRPGVGEALAGTAGTFAHPSSPHREGQEARALLEAARTRAADVFGCPPRELVFTSPTEAWFRYDIDSPMASFADRYGMAVLGEDGVWRLTRQSVCQDLALVPGTTCVPSVSQLLPPSAADDPRYGGGMLEG